MNIAYGETSHFGDPRRRQFAVVTRACWCDRITECQREFFDRCERRDAILYVPTVAMWECGLLARVARINLRRTVRAFFDDLFSNPSYQPLDVTAETVFLADQLRFTRDPFDALICASAQAMALPLITRDALIRRSGAVRVIW
jgi:PIN domain nuclease of toxin-antitoxin system